MQMGDPAFRWSRAHRGGNMKRHADTSTRTSGRWAVGMAVLGLLAACDSGAGGRATPLTPGALSAEEQADLRYLHEEEKLARDVYLHAAARYGSGPFANIASSEQRHLDAVGSLLAAAGVDDSGFDPAQGVFHDSSLAALYASLIQQADLSFGEALRVGATIEDLDLVDLAGKATRSKNDAVLAVYANLQCGSRNHLRSFAGQLQSAGVSWEPSWLTDAEVNAILSGGHESCGSIGR